MIVPFVMASQTDWRSASAWRRGGAQMCRAPDVLNKVVSVMWSFNKGKSETRVSAAAMRL